MTCDPTHLGREGGVWLLPHLDALHGDVVDDPDDAAGAGHGQQGVTGAGVVGPRTRVEVFVCLWGAPVKGTTDNTTHDCLRSRQVRHNMYCWFLRTSKNLKV